MNGWDLWAFWQGVKYLWERYWMFVTENGKDPDGWP